MAIAKVTHIGRSNKAYKCEKCGAEIPKGSAYRRFKVGFRSRYNHYRCMKPECTPRNSELDASKMAAVWDAQETFEAAIETADNAEDMNSALQDYAQALREVGEEYREASEDENGNVFNTTAEERADMLEQAADDVEGIDVDADTTDCERCEGTGEMPCEECGGEGMVGDKLNVTCPTCVGSCKTDCDVDECEDGQVPDVEAMRETAREAMDVDLP